MDITRPRPPDYPVKLSRNLAQQKAVDWLTASGRQHHNSFLEKCFAPWGMALEQLSAVSPCLLLPNDWDGLDPDVLVQIFSPERCPLGDAERLVS